MILFVAILLATIFLLIGITPLFITSDVREIVFMDEAPQEWL